MQRINTSQNQLTSTILHRCLLVSLRIASDTSFNKDSISLASLLTVTKTGVHMIQVSVTSTEVRNQSGNAKASGKPYSLNFQTVYVHTYGRDGKKNPYPEKTEIILEKNEQGAALFYPAGEYTLAPESFYVDRSGNLAVSPRLTKLVPAAAAAKV
jgi:hypothetical protein